MSLFILKKKNIYGVPQRILKNILQISVSTWLDGTVFCLFLGNFSSVSGKRKCIPLINSVYVIKFYQLCCMLCL